MYFCAGTGQSQGRLEARARGAKPGGMPWRAQRADFLIFAKFRKEIGSQQSIRECFATIQNILAFFAPSRPAAGAAIYDL